jgi:hypothetical protein
VPRDRLSTAQYDTEHACSTAQYDTEHACRVSQRHCQWWQQHRAVTAVWPSTGVASSREAGQAGQPTHVTNVSVLEGACKQVKRTNVHMCATLQHDCCCFVQPRAINSGRVACTNTSPAQIPAKKRWCSMQGWWCSMQLQPAQYQTAKHSALAQHRAAPPSTTSTQGCMQAWQFC